MLYKVPMPKAEKPGDKLSTEKYTPPKDSCRFDVSKEMAKAVKVGTPCTVTLKGTIRSVELRESTDKQSSWQNRSEICLELDSIEIPTDEFEELADV